MFTIWLYYETLIEPEVMISNAYCLCDEDIYKQSRGLFEDMLDMPMKVTNIRSQAKIGSLQLKSQTSASFKK
jgi:hypothetical protein